MACWDECDEELATNRTWITSEMGWWDGLEFVGDEGIFPGWEVLEVIEVWDLDVKLEIAGVTTHGKIVGIGEGWGLWYGKTVSSNTTCQETERSYIRERDIVWICIEVYGCCKVWYMENRCIQKIFRRYNLEHDQIRFEKESTSS